MTDEGIQKQGSDGAGRVSAMFALLFSSLIKVGAVLMILPEVLKLFFEVNNE